MVYMSFQLTKALINNHKIQTKLCTSWVPIFLWHCLLSYRLQMGPMLAPWTLLSGILIRLDVLSKDLAKSRDSYLELFDRSEIWQVNSAAMLPRRLSNFKAIRTFWHPISRDFTRTHDKTSYRILKRGQGSAVLLTGSSYSGMRADILPYGDDNWWAFPSRLPWYPPIFVNHRNSFHFSSWVSIFQMISLTFWPSDAI